MRLRKRHVFAAALTGTVALVTTATFALPGPAACALAGVAGLQTIEGGVLTDSRAAVDHQRYLELVREARARIEATFGAPESKPVLVFFNGTRGFGPFRLNSYGSTQMIGSRACVMLGPRGHNVDVVAHELMHGDLLHRVGPWSRFPEVPTWFDESVAMQLDRRSRYRLTPNEAAHADAVRALTTSSSFFVADEQKLTSHYAAAKTVVASWVAAGGPGELYSRLARLRNGEAFTDAIPEREFTALAASVPNARPVSGRSTSPSAQASPR